SGKVNGFCLLTSDSDFTKLAIRLREAGMIVIVMGEQKTPNSLVSACETFKFLDLLYQESLEEQAEDEKLSEVKAAKAAEPPAAIRSSDERDTKIAPEAK
ncbi:NYN domain-containing protein, partial [[Clostridium] symbiosum]|uniref:NYN domain-containing protein n=1 Tax=Clostridium symbiosum TaxID=1512 RepID=UPI00210E96D1